MKPDTHIAHLLERYMLAETTKAEERDLADYFKTHRPQTTPVAMVGNDWHSGLCGARLVALAGD